MQLFCLLTLTSQVPGNGKQIEEQCRHRQAYKGRCRVKNRQSRDEKVAGAKRRWIFEKYLREIAAWIPIKGK